MNHKIDHWVLCCALLASLVGCASPQTASRQQDEACRHYRPQSGAPHEVLTCPLPDYPYTEVMQVSPRNGGMLIFPALVVLLILELQTDGSVEVLGISANEHVSNEFLTRVTRDVERWRTSHRGEQEIVFAVR